MPDDALFLWVNLIDLARVEEAIGTAAPLMQLLTDEEERMQGAYTRPQNDIGDTWIVIKTFGWARANSLADGMDTLAVEALGRRLRMVVTYVPPDTSWACIPE